MAESRTSGEWVTNTSEESLADRGLPLVAMGGAVLGAVAGAVTGAEAGTAFPVACGTLGTLLGSAAAGWAWCLLARLWDNTFVGYETGHARDHARAERLTPASGAKGGT